MIGPLLAKYRRRFQVAKVAAASVVLLVLAYVGYQGRREGLSQARLDQPGVVRDRSRQKLVEDQRSELANLAANYNNRGNLLVGQRKWEAAIADYGKAIELQTRLIEQAGGSEIARNLARSHTNRGNAFRTLGRLDAAIQDFAKVVGIYTRLVNEGRGELANDLAMSHNDRGIALRLRGNLSAAVEDFERAIEIRTRLVQQEGRGELANDLAGSHNNRGNALLDRVRTVSSAMVVKPKNMPVKHAS
jgi:tetratricopeptide (TPR) repeat protein